MRDDNGYETRLMFAGTEEERERSEAGIAGIACQQIILAMAAKWRQGIAVLCGSSHEIELEVAGGLHTIMMTINLATGGSAGMGSVWEKPSVCLMVALEVLRSAKASGEFDGIPWIADGDWS